MGQVYVNIRTGNPKNREMVNIDDVMVDTGAVDTIIPEGSLSSAGRQPNSSRFTTGDHNYGGGMDRIQRPASLTLPVSGIVRPR